MDYLISLNSDTGLVLDKNQDCSMALTASYNNKRIAFAIICDGMGGFSAGEMASHVVVDAFKSWINDFLSKEDVTHDWYQIQLSWIEIINDTNHKLGNYGIEKSIKLGTTLTAVLFIDDEYLAVNVGDSRLYKVTDCVNCITRDHTLVALKVKQGQMTEEQAKASNEKNVLLQCIGASEMVLPDFYSDKVNPNEVYFLCSDGFRHKITNDEILCCMSPEVLVSKEEMNNSSKYLIELNKARQEKDNISIVIVKSKY